MPPREKALGPLEWPGPGDDLRTVVLEEGMEDRIQLPHATEAARMVVGDADAVTALQRVMVDLLGEGLIRVYRGGWSEDRPSRLPDEEALALLGDPRWYSFHLDDASEERLSFVNVQNILPEFR